MHCFWWFFVVVFFVSWKFQLFVSTDGFNQNICIKYIYFRFVPQLNVKGNQSAVKIITTTANEMKREKNCCEYQMSVDFWEIERKREKKTKNMEEKRVEKKIAKNE